MRKIPSQAELEAFRVLLAHEVGFRFEADKLPFLADLLSERKLATRMSTAAYFRHVARSPEEVAELARALTVTETYFLRNRDQFRAFETIIREREASGVRHLRLLSAGSSSGEEAYSLAIVLRETLGSLDGWILSVQGVDLNPDAIARARAASYPAWSLRDTPESIRQKFFRKEGTRFLLSPDIRQMARFEECNLLHPDSGLWRPDAYDVVFCRNVLMYFAPEAARAVVDNIARSLSPGGYLFVGHAETLRGLSQDFHLRHTHDTFYYQYRGAQEARGDDGGVYFARGTTEPEVTVAVPASVTADGNPSWMQAIAQASGKIQRLSQGTADVVEPAKVQPATTKAPDAPAATRGAAGKELATGTDLTPAMDMLKQERFLEALRLLASSPTATPNPDELLLRAMLLVSTGELVPAEQLCEELLGIDELNAGAHYIMAMCREHSGDRPGAIEHSKAAAYLDADFAMPHLQLGRLARRMGQLDAAQRELTLALSLLAREDAARITLFGGGFDREVLMNLCRSELKACGHKI